MTRPSKRRLVYETLIYLKNTWIDSFPQIEHLYMKRSSIWITLELTVSDENEKEDTDSQYTLKFNTLERAEVAGQTEYT